MEIKEKQKIIDEVLSQYSLPGEYVDMEPYGNGHINETLLLTYKRDDGSLKRYILQKINTDIFKNPDELMENIFGVTNFLRKIIAERGGDTSRETMTVVPSSDMRNYVKSKDGGSYRIYDFVEDTITLQAVENKEDFYTVGVSFGTFQKLLGKYPAETLHETIVNFHNTPSRYQDFLRAIEENRSGRASEVAEEIEFVKSREKFMHTLVDAQESGEIPLRVTHNDTKLNNILIDRATGKGICVVDLDTVMPGLLVNDYGDSIRFGASTAAEDETDLDKVWMSLELFEIFTKGFLEGIGDVITERESYYLPVGAKMMTLECGMRFLTDHINGDTYFKIHREGHNLDRARTQFKLVSDMEKKWDEMYKIVGKYTSLK